MKYIRNKMLDSTTFADIVFFYFSSFIFKANHVFMEEKDNPAEKVVIDEGDLHGIVIDGILNLENVPRAVFID